MKHRIHYNSETTNPMIPVVFHYRSLQLANSSDLAPGDGSTKPIVSAIH